ncbi:peptidase [bacterium]|nr:peptidase [bacterium]
MFISEVKRQIAAEGDRTISFLQDLVRIPSVTGNEGAVQAYLSKELASLGLEIDAWQPSREELQKHPVFSDDGLPLEGRPVIVGRWHGSGGGRSLILNGHVDVVPPGDPQSWIDGPWSGIVRDGKLYGRGACDMKGGLVAGIAAIRTLQKMGLRLRGDVMIQCVTGEETGGIGTLATILRGYRADSAVILEPTRLDLCPVGAGAASFRLHVPGLAAHAAMRQQGVSAIEKFLFIHALLMSLEKERNAGFQHPLYKDRLPAPISIGKVQAGDWPSTVPDNLVAEGRYGILPGENLNKARKLFEQKIRKEAHKDSWLSQHPPEVEWFEGQFEPAETALDSDVIKVLSECHYETTGKVPAIHGVSYGSDLRFFTNNAGMPAVLYGPGDVAQAHSVNEFISLEQLFTATQTVACMMIRWCEV